MGDPIKVDSEDLGTEKPQPKPQQEREPAPIDDDGVPWCRVHYARMKPYSTRNNRTNYKCKVPGCKESGVRRKHWGKQVPREPQHCPECSTDKTAVYCEAVQHRRVDAGIKLVCPRCRWNTVISASHAGAIYHQMTRRQKAGTIGER